MRHSLICYHPMLKLQGRYLKKGLEISVKSIPGEAAVTVVEVEVAAAAAVDVLGDEAAMAVVAVAVAVVLTIGKVHMTITGHLDVLIRTQSGQASLLTKGTRFTNIVDI